MGLITFFLTIIGGIAIFIFPSWFLLLEAQKAGFALDNTLAGVVVVVISIALVLLWPVVWVLKFLFYKVRKKEMPPVRPEVEIPKWMSFSFKFVVTLFILFSVLSLFSVAFLKMATLGYHSVSTGISAVENSSTLGTIKLSHLSEDALPLRDIDVLSRTDERWSLHAQAEELWVVSVYYLDFPEWVHPFTDKFALKPVARLGTLSNMADEGMSVQPVLALGEETVTEYVLLVTGKYLPFFSFQEIQSKPATLNKEGQVLPIVFSGEVVLLGAGTSSDNDSADVDSSNGSDSSTITTSESDTSMISSESTTSSGVSSTRVSDDSTASDDSTDSDEVDKTSSDDDFEFGDDF